MLPAMGLKNKATYKTAIHYDPILYIKIENIIPKY